MLVLIAVDASEHADAAFRFYMKHLHRANNRLLLVYSLEVGLPTEMLPMAVLENMTPEQWNAHMEKEKMSARGLEERYNKMLAEYPVSGRIHIAYGNDPGQAIVEEAEHSKASLIVMGSRGQGKLRRTFLGSVSDYVLHHAHCPVTICAQRKRTEPRTATEESEKSAKGKKEQSKRSQTKKTPETEKTPGTEKTPETEKTQETKKTPGTEKTPETEKTPGTEKTQGTEKTPEIEN